MRRIHVDSWHLPILAATQLLTGSLGVVQAAQMAGLLYVGRNLVQVVLSHPVGVLADRFGAQKVLRIGYGFGALTAVLVVVAFVVGAGLPLLAAIFLVAGLYMAVQEALEATVTAELVPAAARGMGFGALGTVNGVTKFISSGLVGLLWTAVSPVAGFGFAAVAMAVGTWVLARLPKEQE